MIGKGKELSQELRSFYDGTGLRRICNFLNDPVKWKEHHFTISPPRPSAPYKVIVIAMMLRKEKVALQCHLYCHEQLYSSKAKIDIHWDHFGFPYGTADILCPLPSGCGTPTRVAITTGAIRNKGTEVSFRNQKVLTNFSYTFTSCFSTMYNFTNVLQVTFELLQYLGVNRVVVYKTNCSADTQRVLDYYTKKGLVEVIPWSLSNYLTVSRKALPKQDPADIHYFGQIPALNDCLYRYMYQSKYVALHDPDEYILPHWVELLPILEKRYGAGKCYIFENNWIPVEFALTPPPPHTLPQQKQWQNISGVNILTHIYNEPIAPKPAFNNYKIITNPRAVFAVSVHGVLKPWKTCTWTDRKIARMYHIKLRGKTELKPEQLIYDNRLLNYNAQLSSAVNIVLRDTGLLSEDNLN
uniref:Glycosyltransferase family 92 protein n=1 Tax=Cyprinodon variegatus TaxID=28743 RepID=A0A3Q2GP03_CYPVA